LKPDRNVGLFLLEILCICHTDYADLIQD